MGGLVDESKAGLTVEFDVGHLFAIGVVGGGLGGQGKGLFLISRLLGEISKS